MKKDTGRDLRQDQGIELWKKAKGRGTCLYPTGFGKTKTALKLIARLRKQQSNFRVIVIVPSEALQLQWERELKAHELNDIQVLIVNSAIKSQYDCDILVVDKCNCPL